jgi:hypothetical protein
MADPKKPAAAAPARPAAPRSAAPGAAIATTKAGAVAKADAPEGEAAPKEGKLAWFVGWILVPGALLGGIWTGGVALGAHLPESWFARAVMWVAGLF